MDKLDNLHNYGTDEEPLYIVSDIANVFEIPKRSIRRYVKNLIPLDFYIQDTTIIKRGSNQRKIKCNLINKKGLWYILSNTRRPVCPQLLKYLNIEIQPLLFPEEKKWLTPLKTVFKDDLKIQYPIYPYRLDGYIPIINLVIEVDEEAHKYYNKLDALERSITINFELKNPKYLRIRPDDDIFEVIHKIHMMLRDVSIF